MAQGITKVNDLIHVVNRPILTVAAAKVEDFLQCI